MKSLDDRSTASLSGLLHENRHVLADSLPPSESPARLPKALLTSGWGREYCSSAEDQGADNRSHSPPCARAGPFVDG